MSFELEVKFKSDAKPVFNRHDQFHLLFVMTWSNVMKKSSPKKSRSKSNSTITERL